MGMFDNWLNTPVQQQDLLPVDPSTARSMLQGSIAATPQEMRGYTAPATSVLQGQDMQPVTAKPQSNPEIPLNGTGGAASAAAAVDPAAAIKQEQRQKYNAYQSKLAGYEHQAETYS